MQVRRKDGKYEIEVIGSEEQIEKALSRWKEEISHDSGSDKKLGDLCRFIRAKARELKITEDETIPCITLVKQMLGDLKE